MLKLDKVAKADNAVIFTILLKLNFFNKNIKKNFKNINNKNYEFREL